jgi:methionyl-tRNA synthetase
MSKPRFISTTIPYVNAPPHIGFALELVQADVLARYHRLSGADVRFQTGTDENAFKNVLSAKARGIAVQQLVDRNSERFRALADLLDVSIDRFVRTTDPAHRHAVSVFLSRVAPDDLYRRQYEGLYCYGCEDFYLAVDADDGRCPEHGTTLVAVSEENVFFRLSRYANTVRELISSRRLRIVPEARELEVLRFIDRGLADISISRDARRSDHWGIPFPGAPSQVVYVWIDALINYLSGLGYPDSDDITRYWLGGTRSHAVGKNVWKFHAVYWPALLLSAGLPVPDEIFVHGFLTNEGRKISKSAGDAVDPAEYVARFGVDAVRYFLLRHIQPFEDSDFSVERVELAYEADLANGIGNLVSRVSALCASAGVEGLSGGEYQEAPAGYHEHVTSFRFDRALTALWSEIAEVNRELGAARPWEDLRAARLTLAREKLSRYALRLATIAHWLSPFLPSASQAILEGLSQPRIARRDPLFPRTASTDAA